MDGGKVFGLLTLAIPLVVIITRSYYSSSKQQQQEQQEEEEEEEEQVKASPWGGLDRNLLGEIVSKLCVTDQARFRAVCTNWLIAAHPIINDEANATNTKSSSLLPWHGCEYPGSCSEFQLYDPLSSSPNHMVSRHIIDWSQLGVGVGTCVVSSLVVRHNWVLVTIKKSRSLLCIRRHIFLYSPLSNRIITLPTFDYRPSFEFIPTFSAPPDSKDCVFCMVDATRCDIIAILTYQYGDKEWTAREFAMHPRFERLSLPPHILSGILYIPNYYGQVASYNILNGEFNFDLLQPDNIFCQDFKEWRVDSFVFDGELTILCLTLNPNNNNIRVRGLHGLPFIRRYDRSLKVWIPVTTLGYYALFSSDVLSNVLVIKTKHTIGVLPNKVYHFFNGGCVVYSIYDLYEGGYSLYDGILYKFKSINSNLLEDGGLEDGGDNLPAEYKYSYATPPTRLAYWLQVPRLRSSPHTIKVKYTIKRHVALETRKARHSTCPWMTNQNFLVRFCMGIFKCNIF